MQYRSEQIKKLYSSARGGRVTKVYFAPPFLIFFVFGISLLFQLPASYITHKISFTLGMLLNQVAILLIPALVLTRVFNFTREVVLPFNRVAPLVMFFSLLIMSSLALITDYLIFITEALLPISQNIEELYKELMSVKGFGEYIYKFAFLCILPGFCEEIFFRGFCQTGLMKAYGKWAGILITALLFSIAHLSVWYIHLYFILGVVLGWLFAGTGSLWVPITCHMVNNAWTFTMYVLDWKLPVKGKALWPDSVVLSVALVVLALSFLAWKRLALKKVRD